MAARSLNGGDPAGLRGFTTELAAARLRPAAVGRLLAAQVWPSRRHALQWLGRRSSGPTAVSEAAFVDLVARAIGYADWPPALIVVAVCLVLSSVGSVASSYFLKPALNYIAAGNFTGLPA